MTPSERTRRRARTAVTSIMATLEKDDAAELIDRPIDAVLGEFRLGWSCPPTARAYHQVFGKLVREIVIAMARTQGRVPVDGWCRDLALELIELGYRGTDESGYAGALLDVLYAPDPLFSEGIDGVLIQLASLIKARFREAYVRSIFSRHLDPCDRSLRLAIAAELQSRYRHILSAELRQAEPFELAARIPELLTAIFETGQRFRHLTIDSLGD